MAECKHNRSLLLDRLKSSRGEEPADLEYEGLVAVVDFLQEVGRSLVGVRISCRTAAEGWASLASGIPDCRLQQEASRHCALLVARNAKLDS